MNEVQKILDDTLCGFALAVGQGNGTINDNLTQTKQALYDLLMEKAVLKLVKCKVTPQEHSERYTLAIPVSTINELFGRTE